MKRKLCFVIPEYDEATPTHFNYLYSFIGSISRDFDVFLLIERGRAPVKNLKCAEIRVLKSKFLLWRWCEFKFQLLRARLKGYKDFYIHYSFFGAFVASLVVKIFGGRTFYWNCGLPWQYKRNFLREFFERLVYKTVSFLVTGTEGLKAEYAKHYCLSLEKIKVMPNWIDVSDQQQATSNKKNELRKSLKIKDAQKIILFAHRLSKRKGAHYLPEILEKIADAKLRNNANDAKDFVLIVIGDGPERKDLEFRIQNLGLTSSVRFLGWVPQDKMADYFAIADVFIMSSEEEGFPHVLLESMAAGISFVAFDVGGVKEIIPKKMERYLSRRGDVVRFANKVKELLEEPSERIGQLADLEKEWVKRFDLNLAVDRFLKLITVDSVKILLAINDLAFGGGQRTVIEEANRLSEKGYGVYVLNTLPRAEDSGFGGELKIPANRRIVIPFKSLSDFRAFRKLVKTLHVIKPDIILSSLFFTNTIIRLVKLLSPRIKIIVREGNVPVEKGFGVRLADFLLSFLTFKIVVNAEAVKKEFKKLLIPKSKVEVIYNGIGDEFFRIRPERREKDRLTLLAIGSLNKKKGHRYLLEALAGVLKEKQKKTIGLLLIGDGPLLGNLQNQARALNLENVITFLRATRQISDSLAKADVLILPSLWEGLPNVMLEAMAAGVPVIATAVGGVPEVIQDGENGLLVKPADVQSLKQAISKVCQSAAVRGAFAKNAKSSAAQYTWERHVAKLAEIINQAI